MDKTRDWVLFVYYADCAIQSYPMWSSERLTRGILKSLARLQFSNAPWGEEWPGHEH